MAAFSTTDQQAIEAIADALVASLQSQGVTVKSLSIEVSAEVEIPATRATVSTAVSRAN